MMIRLNKPAGAAGLSGLALLLMAMTPAGPVHGTLTLSICGADGVTRTISVPLDQDKRDEENCLKACHAVCSRKQAADDLKSGKD